MTTYEEIQHLATTTSSIEHILKISSRKWLVTTSHMIGCLQLTPGNGLYKLSKLDFPNLPLSSHHQAEIIQSQLIWNMSQDPPDAIVGILILLKQPIASTTSSERVYGYLYVCSSLNAVLNQTRVASELVELSTPPFDLFPCPRTHTSTLASFLITTTQATSPLRLYQVQTGPNQSIEIEAISPEDIKEHFPDIYRLPTTSYITALLVICPETPTKDTRLWIVGYQDGGVALVNEETKAVHVKYFDGPILWLDYLAASSRDAKFRDKLIVTSALGVVMSYTNVRDDGFKNAIGVTKSSQSSQHDALVGAKAGKNNPAEEVVVGTADRKLILFRELATNDYQVEWQLEFLNAIRSIGFANSCKFSSGREFYNDLIVATIDGLHILRLYPKRPLRCPPSELLTRVTRILKCCESHCEL